MSTNYEMILLSDLLKKSRIVPHPDFILAQEYISKRLENLGSVSSEFNNWIRWIKKILPFSILYKFLYHLRYDALVGFCEEEENREVYGMVSFQKHPFYHKIGMFDIYVSPERRGQDLSNHFQQLSQLVYELTLRFRDSGYEYLQCGKNETTKKLLTLYQKITIRNNWNCEVDVLSSRIYLK